MMPDARCLLGVRHYAATTQQVRLAKLWIREILTGHVDKDTLFDVSLCAVELVDNARKHGRADGVITVSVYTGADLIRIEVTGESQGEAVPRVTGNLLTEDGHGLKIVSGLAKQWGAHQDRDLNQIVWCEFLRECGTQNKG
ncbi:MAG TPA: ATP-binding protein [Streptosporangiaceae bacterium]|nr:ATP-binding protein [Streptosporangiaceae bacterium]